MDAKDVKRYYPQKAELSILNGSIVKYFSYADRSSERSVLAVEVSKRLQQYSKHWTKRAVRLWYNNNKGLLSGKIKFSSGDFNLEGLQSPSSLSTDGKENDSQPDTPTSTSSNAFSFDLSTPDDNNSEMPIMHMDNELTDIPMHSESVLSEQNKLPPKLSVHFDSVLPSNSHRIGWDTDQMMNVDQNKVLSDKLIAIIEKQKNNSIFSAEATNEYEIICNQMLGPHGHFPIEYSPSFKRINFPHSSIDGKSVALWQQRANKTHPIVNFDSTFNGSDISMYIHTSQLNPERVIEVLKNGSWFSIQTGTKDIVESCTSDSDFCYFITLNSIYVADLNTRTQIGSGVQLTKNIATVSSICEAGNHMALGGFGTSPYIFYANTNGEVFNICIDGIPDNWGLSSICCINENFGNGAVIAYINSPVLRVVDAEGKVIRSLFGHTGPTNQIKSVNGLVLTASEDKTTKIWDIRSQCPAISLSADSFSTTDCCLTETYALLSSEDRTFRLFDIRNPSPVLGIKTDEYTMVSPYFNEKKDTLRSFGVASKDGINDSMLFLDDNMESSKYIFREYAPFMSSLLF